MLALVTPVGAGMVPGGGTAASDCYAELDVAGIDNDGKSVKGNKKVLCVDGDPCDSGPCGDGVCDFQVRLCWNQRDPNVAACSPVPALDSLDLRGPLAALMLMPRDLSGATCTDAYTDFGVPTKLNGKKPGRLNVRIIAKAPPGTKPMVDNDVIRLACVPRPFEECPGATTTTTSTTLAGATTTTPVTDTTTTTRRRPRKTTTTTTFKLPTTIPTITIPTTLLPSTTLPTTSTTETATTSLPEPTTLPETTTLPEPTTIPEPTTLVPTTTTPTFEPTTTTERRHGHGDDEDLIGIPIVPIL